MLDDSRLIGAVRRPGNEEIRVALATYQGVRYVDVRTYFQNKSGDWAPTRKGVVVPPAKLAELRQLLDEADHEMKSAGWQ